MPFAASFLCWEFSRKHPEPPGKHDIMNSSFYQENYHEYSIQFESGNYKYFKMVEKACRKVINKKDKAVFKERCSEARTLGHL